MSSSLDELSHNCLSRIIHKLNNIEHIKTKNTTYFLHMKRALYYSTKLATASFLLAIHSIFPNIFETYASDKVKQISKEI